MSATRLPKVFTNVPSNVITAEVTVPYLDAEPGDILMDGSHTLLYGTNEYRFGNTHNVPLSISRRFADFIMAFSANPAFVNVHPFMFNVSLDVARTDVKQYFTEDVEGMLRHFGVDMIHPVVLNVLRNNRQSDCIFLSVYTLVMNYVPRHLANLCLKDEDGNLICEIRGRREEPNELFRTFGGLDKRVIVCDDPEHDLKPILCADNWYNWGSQSSASADYAVFKGPASELQKQRAELESVGAKNIVMIEPFHDVVMQYNPSRYEIVWQDGAKVSWYYKWKTIVEFALTVSVYHLPPYVMLWIIDWLPGMWAFGHQRKLNVIQSLWNSLERIRDQRNEIKT